MTPNIKWYSIASAFVNVPKIDGPNIENIISNGRQFKIYDVINAIHLFSFCQLTIPFRQYIDDIFKLCKNANDFYDIIPMLEKDKNIYDCRSTFMHGNLTFNNLIQTDEGLFFINPSWKETEYSSYLLDIASMLNSYRINHRMIEYNVFMNKWISDDLSIYNLQLLELTQYIKLCVISNNKNMIKSYHQMFKQLKTNNHIS